MNNFKILGITQTNEKYFFKDVKIKTILEETGYKTAKPIFRDLKNGGRIKTGYYLTLNGYTPLWIELFNIERYKFNQEGLK